MNQACRFSSESWKVPAESLRRGGRDVDLKRHASIELAAFIAIVLAHRLQCAHAARPEAGGFHAAMDERERNLICALLAERQILGFDAGIIGVADHFDLDDFIESDGLL